MAKAKKKVENIFSEALKSVDPYIIVTDQAEKIHSGLSENDFRDLFVIGFGKASWQMAGAIEEIFGTAISEGIVITKYGHAKKERSAGNSQESGDLKKIKVFEAGHPVPDENGTMATREIIRLLEKTDERSLLLCLLSGGGSALFVSPCEGITLGDKQMITDQLLRAGADITELNSVRKHLSAVKGGRLAEIAYPATIISMIISDVIGDKLDVIASGPTAPDHSTFDDADNVLNKFNLREKAPKSVLDIIERGKKGLIPDTPKADNSVFKNVTNLIIGNNQKALDAAEREAVSLGFETEIISSSLTGEARETGKWLAKKAMETKKSSGHHPRCLISGGETTVTVKGKGKGGRNTELALSFAMEIEGVEGVTLLSAGTDGTDGPTDAAGAIVDGETIPIARRLGLNPEEYLKNNDSYNFFKQTGSLLITGPTGTNVMDIQIVLLE